MLESCNRAFKEWDISCKALREGRQSLLVRKGGILEVNGGFHIEDREFWLMPTFDHQNTSLLQSAFAEELQRSGRANPDPNSVVIQGYAEVDSIYVATEEAQVNALSNLMIWNAQYVKMRFDYNPYEPLYLILLRAYSLPEPIKIPQSPGYGGCRSWITLDQSLSTGELYPALSADALAAQRREIESIVGMANQEPVAC